MNRLDGKIAIITGAARGQGAAEARLFVDEGAVVVLGDVLTAELHELADELGEAAIAVPSDVTSPAHWRTVVDTAVSFGGVDVLVNNAAITWTRPIEHESAEELRRMLDVNLVGAFLGMQAVLDPMRARGGGSIVNVSSLAGLTGLPYHGAYGASKWALRGMSRTAAVEFGRDGIRVNCVHPGPIDTPMLPEPAPGAADERFAHLPLGRVGRAEEVAALVLHLASDESSYQTGGEYVIDGGSHAGPPRRYEWTPT